MINNTMVLDVVAPDRRNEAIGYYGGTVAGVSALYSAVSEAAGLPVRSVYDVNDLPGYESYDYRDCPFCKKGHRVEALVNSFGYSEFQV